VKFFNCRKPGHWKKDCFAWKKAQDGAMVAMKEDVALAAWQEPETKILSRHCSRNPLKQDRKTSSGVKNDLSELFEDSEDKDIIYYGPADSGNDKSSSNNKDYGDDDFWDKVGLYTQHDSEKSGEKSRKRKKMDSVECYSENGDYQNNYEDKNKKKTWSEEPDSNFQSETESRQDSEKLYARIAMSNRNCDKNNDLEHSMFYDTYDTSDKDKLSMASTNDSETEEYKWIYGSHQKKCCNDKEEEKLFRKLHVRDD
jgi:hypothetical protein